MKHRLNEEIAQLMLSARADTLRLFRLADERYLHDSPGFGFRPIIWHLAHMGVFEAYWILQKMRGEPPPDARYERIFDPINTPREKSRDLPSRFEMENFLSNVRERVFAYLEEVQFTENDAMLRDGYVFRLILEHEYQHQETLLYLLQLLDPAAKTRPGSSSIENGVGQPAHMPRDMADIPGGPATIGSVWNGFSYDNELPAHVVEVAPFRIDRLLTTNAQYAQFVAEGGYTRREWWSEEGWRWRENENWNSPLFWKEEGDGRWSTRTMFEASVWQPDHPVTGVTWFEAQAYARFAGKRLPTEIEWETAASQYGSEKRRLPWGNNEPDATLANFHDHYWGTTPVGALPGGATASGLMDMTGNVWEWTADTFAGYEGFRPYPYPEYSKEWFDGDHRVLKGGSWATRAPILRTSFRNFFRPQFRIAFAGIRCASDV